MQCHERTLTAKDGTAIFVTDWLPEAAADAGVIRGGIVLMHGLGEHSGRYGHVAHFFNDAGWAVRAYDHRGHGRSGGPRGDVPDNDCILHDAKMVVDDFARQCANPPLLLGHSMGGLLAARFAAESWSPLGGLILSSPALALSLSRIQKLLLTVLGATAPGYAISNGLETRFLTHDPTVIDAYSNDALVHGTISARLLRCMLASIEIAHRKAPGLTLPTLMVVAGDDRMVDANGSQIFCAHLPPGVGTMHVYPQLYHEVLNEVEARPVFDDIRHWLQKRQG